MDKRKMEGNSMCIFAFATMNTKDDLDYLFIYLQNLETAQLPPKGILGSVQVNYKNCK